MKTTYNGRHIYDKTDILKAAELLNIDPGNPLIPKEYRQAITMLQEIANGMDNNDGIICADNTTILEHDVL